MYTYMKLVTRCRRWLTAHYRTAWCDYTGKVDSKTQQSTHLASCTNFMCLSLADKCHTHIFTYDVLLYAQKTEYIPTNIINLTKMCRPKVERHARRLWRCGIFWLTIVSEKCCISGLSGIFVCVMSEEDIARLDILSTTVYQRFNVSNNYRRQIWLILLEAPGERVYFFSSWCHY